MGVKGVPVGGYGVDVVVGLHWNVGDVCKNWSHICGSWYLPKFLLRGVLSTDEHSFLYGPRWSRF